MLQEGIWGLIRSEVKEFVLLIARYKVGKTKEDEIDGARVTCKDMGNASIALVDAYKRNKLLGRHRGRRYNNIKIYL
jgi:hypothetical protein